MAEGDLAQPKARQKKRIIQIEGALPRQSW
jgi:hypothetical protein